MNNSNAPFAIGQKVVCIKNSRQRDGYSINKGEVFVVKGLSRCAKCNLWKIDVGVVASYSGRPLCNKCGSIYANTISNIVWASAINFAPIETQYSDATKEILEKFPITEETPDKVLVPETVSN